VSRNGYYAWRKRGLSARARKDQQLVVKIKALHAENRGTYGRPRITDELNAQGAKVSQKRIGRLMRENDIAGRHLRRFRKTTDSSHKMPVAPNLIERQFNAKGPNQLWAGDITYIRTWEGWLYLAVVIDLYSRRVVGWALANHMRTELVSNALQMAIDQRCPPKGLIFHSDRGSQYASKDYQKLLKRYGIRCSMSRKGDCWDNAVVESFFSTLKEELICRNVWPTRKLARNAINEYIICFYNSRRRHSRLGSMSPMAFEKINGQHLLAA
jgi:putative transposase